MPGSQAFTPLVTYLPSGSGFSALHTSHGAGPCLLVKTYHLVSLPEVDKSVKQEVYVTVRITLGVHALSNFIGRQFSDVNIFEFHQV